jgi:hypothetical protein
MSDNSGFVQASLQLKMASRGQKSGKKISVAYYSLLGDEGVNEL